MRKYFGVIRYAVSCILCFCVILFSLFNLVPKINIIQTNTKAVKTENKVQVNQIKIEESTETKTQEEGEKQAVSSNKVYKGKIISKYISSKAASLSYKNVYVKNSSGANINIKELLSAELPFQIKKTDAPQVLIVHTHTTETFMKEESEYYTEADTPRTRNTEYNMVKIGQTVAKKLNDAGIVTVHATEEHDYPEYTGSYSRAAKTIKKYIEKYPSIKVVLDIHRDAVSSGKSDKVKLVTKINGKKAAQVMLVMGSETGSVTAHPNWKENLKLAVKLQNTLETDYEGLARPLFLTSKRYNQNLTKGSLLIEIGTDANTIDEAVLSASFVGEAIAKVLKE